MLRVGIIGLWKILDQMLSNGSIAEPVHQLHYVGCQNWHILPESWTGRVFWLTMPAFLAGFFFSVDSTGFSHSHEFNFPPKARCDLCSHSVGFWVRASVTVLVLVLQFNSSLYPQDWWNQIWEMLFIFIQHEVRKVNKIIYYDFLKIK